MNVEKIIKAIEICKKLKTIDVSPISCDEFFYARRKELFRDSSRKIVSYWIAFYLDPQYPKTREEYDKYRVSAALRRVFNIQDVNIGFLSHDKEDMIELLKGLLESVPKSELIKAISDESRQNN